MLLYDIENTPNLGWVWGRWQQDVVAMESHWYMLSFAWKWLGERRTHVLGLPDFALYKREPDNDRELVKVLRGLLDEADIAVAHNGVAFDGTKAATRMLLHGIDPPSSYRDVDTLKVARRQFAFTSNRLGDLCSLLGIASKAETGGFKTWLGCMNGDEAAWRRMLAYNKKDVQILESVYERFLPWISRHPNVASFGDRPDACPRCGSTDGMISRGYHVYSVTQRRRYQCRACRGYCMGRKAERLPTEYVAA